MGPPSYMRSVVERHVIMRRMTVYVKSAILASFDFRVVCHQCPFFNYLE